MFVQYTHTEGYLLCAKEMATAYGRFVLPEPDTPPVSVFVSKCGGFGFVRTFCMYMCVCVCVCVCLCEYICAHVYLHVCKGCTSE